MRGERLPQRRRLDISDSEEEDPAGSEVDGTGFTTVHTASKRDADLEGADAVTTLRALNARVEGAESPGKVRPRAAAVSVLTA